MSCNKQTYSKKEAQTNLKKLINSGRWNGKTKGRIYECLPCNGWHITHTEPKSVKPETFKLSFKNKWKKLL